MVLPVLQWSAKMVDASSNRPADPAVEAAARGRVVSKHDRRGKVKQKTHDRPQARAPPASPGAEIRAYSIPEFCRVHGGISQAFFHALVAKGKGPRLMKVGARTFITTEAAAAWRAQQEAATEQAS
jgi:hypothetical protein